jgi:hypothetical protein
MKKKLNCVAPKKHDFLEIPSKVVGVHKSEDLVKNERIEWLRQLYAEWLEKRYDVLNIDKEPFLMTEPDEFDAESYWYGF